MPDTQKIVWFRTLVHRLKMDEDTMREMIWNASNKRSKSTKDLTNREINYLISKLYDLAGDVALIKLDEKNRLRRKIISLMKTIGVAEIQEIKATIKKHWKKEFNHYTIEEYRKIIGVIERQWVPFYLNKSPR